MSDEGRSQRRACSIADLQHTPTSTRVGSDDAPDENTEPGEKEAQDRLAECQVHGRKANRVKHGETQSTRDSASKPAQNEPLKREDVPRPLWQEGLGPKLAHGVGQTERRVRKDDDDVALVEQYGVFAADVHVASQRSTCHCLTAATVGRSDAPCAGKEAKFDGRNCELHDQRPKEGEQAAASSKDGRSGAR